MADMSTSAPERSLGRSLTIASAIMMSSVMLSRVLGFVREQVLAYYFGTSGEMDAYLVSFAIPELLNHFLAGGFLSITFIPIFQKYLFRKEPERAWKVFSNLFTTGSIVLIALVLIAMAGTGQFLSLLQHMGWKEVSEARFALTVRMTRIILPAQLFFYWGALLMAVQYAHHRFFLPALSPLIYNGAIIACGSLLVRRFGIEGFSWGVLLGSLLGNVAVQLPGALKTGLRYRPIIAVRDPDLVRYVLLTVPLVLGLSMTFSNEFFFRIFGAFLGEGAVASLNYSLRTMMILVGVFGQASGVASFPFLSRLAVENKFGEMSRLLNTIASKLVIAIVPLSAVMIALSAETIGLLFERGRFTVASTMATAPVLVWYTLAALPLSANMVLVRNFYAMQNTWFPMLVGTSCTCAALPGYWYLGRLLGAQGIALSVLISVLVQYVVLYMAWSRKHGNMAGFASTNILALKCWAIGVAGAAICFGGKALLAALVPGLSGWRYYLGALGSAGAGGLCAIAVLYHITGIQRFRDYARVFGRK
jgi:putative peptidoglycan lipid II flippase